MSGEWLSPEEPPHQVTYAGTPKNRDKPGERGHWNLFCEWALPWLKRKRQLGDDYLEAKVLNEVAAAVDKLAQAKERMANAAKTAAETAEIASRLDAVKGPAINEELRTKSLDIVISERIEELEAKIRAAALMHGTRIEVIEPPSQDPIFTPDRIDE